MTAYATATLPETALGWAEISALTSATETGKKLAEEEALRATGEGLPHITAKLRLFGHSEEDVRVTLYRDHAGWCPYCQKLWMMFELKKIPYRIERINMRSYGEKPAWFLKKVPSGLLPVVELDGEIITESLVIMQILENTFPDNCMLPESGFDKANELLRLERHLFSDWCGLVFRPGMPGPFGGGAKKQFEVCLDEVDTALGESAGPWFLGGDTPSIVDLQYVSHIERMNPASTKLTSCFAWSAICFQIGAASCSDRVCLVRSVAVRKSSSRCALMRLILRLGKARVPGSWAVTRPQSSTCNTSRTSSA